MKFEEFAHENDRDLIFHSHGIGHTAFFDGRKNIWKDKYLGENKTAHVTVKIEESVNAPPSRNKNIQ